MARYFLVFFAAVIASVGDAREFGVRLKDFARIDGDRQISLVGYGIVVGLQGSGDTSKNKVTLQSLANTLNNFGLQVDERDLSAKNVAAVMITGELPVFGESGDKIDIQVASTGDAKSLSGGTLLMTPMYGPNQKLYALAQGSITTGGYQVESFSNFTRKNHTTVGQITGGATIESNSSQSRNNERKISVILNEPDYTTASRIVSKIKSTFEMESVAAIHPGKINIVVDDSISPMEFIARLENISVVPDVDARVIVNEKTGTIVAGSNVILGEVSIAHGELRIEVETKFDASQPQLAFRTGSGVQTVVTPDTKIKVTEGASPPVNLPAGTTVGELVQALNRIRVSTRDTISILQSVKAAGALHADLIIQ